MRRSDRTSGRIKGAFYAGTLDDEQWTANLDLSRRYGRWNVAAGAELLRLIRQSRLEWRGNLPEAELIRVQEGTSVIVDSPDGSQAQARVRRVAAAVDSASRTGIVYATLLDAGPLRAGMFAQGQLLLGETPALLLPLAAVVQRDGHSYVFRVGAEQRVTRQRVEIGRVDGKRGRREGDHQHLKKAHHDTRL